MTLQNFIKNYKSQKRGTPKLLVRDLDEIEKNTFVAYVDENDTSYDVKLVFDSKQQVVESSCDCEQSGICQHLVALASHLIENRKEKTVVKTVRKKKVTEIDQLIDDQNQDEVIEWLKSVLNKNKEWALAFKQKFSKNDIEINAIIINKTIEECFISICGRRKKLEPNEIKKIVDNLEMALKPYIETISNNFSYENYLLQINLFDILKFHIQKYKFKSTRFETLIEKLQNLGSQLFNQIKDINLWEKAVQKIMLNVFEIDSNILHQKFISNLHENCLTDETKKKIIFNTLELCLKSTSQLKIDKLFDLNIAFKQLICKIIVDNQSFDKYFNLFKTDNYHIESNLFIIENLIAINQIALAENYCKKEIAKTNNYTYNKPYFQLLIKIFKESNRLEDLTKLYLKIGLFYFDIDIYNHLKIHALLPDLQKFLFTILPKLEDASCFGDVNAFKYYYEIKKDVGKEKDILELFEYITNLDLIIEFLEIACEIDTLTFLKHLSDADIYEEDNSVEKLNHLVEKMINQIPHELLKKATKKNNEFWSNDLFIQLKKQLNQ